MELQEQISNLRKQGYNDAKIRQSLRDTGWPNADIDKALAMPKAPLAHESSKRNSLAVPALILSFLIPIAGLIVGIISLSQIKKTNEEGNGLATAAVVISLVNMFLGFVLILPLIASLAYFGVLDPARMLPERCQFPAGIDCIDKASITSDSITVALRNNIAFPLSVDDISITGATCTGAEQVDTGSGFFTIAGQEVPNTDVFRIKFNDCDLKTGDKFDGIVNLYYTNTESGFQNMAPGDVRGRVT